MTNEIQAECWDCELPVIEGQTYILVHVLGDVRTKRSHAWHYRGEPY